MVDSLTEEYIQVWEDVCNIESPSAFKEGVDAIGNYCIAIANKNGWQVDVCPQEVSGNAVCITLNPDVTTAPVAISGHMDTVHPVGSFGTPTVWRDEEKIYGPGTLDCKSGVVLGLFVMDVLQRNLDLLDRVNQVLSDAGMRTLEPVKMGGGSDAADVTAAGIPCLDGMGPRGDGVHSLREFAYLASMPEAAKQLATILYHI